MNKLLAILFILFSLAFSAQDYAVLSNPDACKKSLVKKSNETNTIMAGFVEKVYSTMFNEPKESNGQFKYKKENKIRWEKLKQPSEVIIINEGSIKMMKDGKEVDSPMNNKIAKRMQSMIIKIVNSKFLDESEFTISYFENKAYYKLHLLPKNKRMAKYITSIDLVFKKSDLSLYTISIFETEMDYVEYTFSDVKYNTAISNDTFIKF